MRLSIRNKLLSVCIATAIFVLLAVVLAGLFFERPLGQTFVGAFLIGFSVSVFEEFYVQGRAGRWLRAMHPLKSIIIYSAVILVIFLVVMPVNHALFGRLDQIGNAYARLPTFAPLVLILAVTAITMLRVVGFIGAKNLFYLIIGKYHRPVLESKLFLFLDIKGSTALVEALGPTETRALIGKFFFDISTPITDHGGEIYRFTGDGVVATWDWDTGITDNRIVGAIDGIRQAVEDEKDGYRSRFGRVPEFRIGVHGGEIIISEEGDTKRAIGFYGDTIHIAARMEQKAKEIGVDCLLTETIAERLTELDDRLKLVQRETVRGISKEIGMYALESQPSVN